MQEILYLTIGDVSTTKLHNKINEIENSYNTDQADFWEAFLRITVKAGLEKRRYLLFASLSEAKSLVSAAFFTERERPAGIVMPKRHSVFLPCFQRGLYCNNAQINGRRCVCSGQFIY